MPRFGGNLCFHLYKLFHAVASFCFVVSIQTHFANITFGCIYGYLSEKVTYWLFKIFEIQKGRTFSFNDFLLLCTIVVNIAIRIRA